MERFLPPYDADAAQREITETIRRNAGGVEPEKAPPDQVFRQETVAGVSALHDTTRLVRLTEALVGHMPPEPPTLRGRVGAWIIRNIRRALFWYTPAILEFHHNVTCFTEQQVAVIEDILREHASLRSSILELQNNDELRQELLKESAARKALDNWIGSEFTSAQKTLTEISTNFEQAQSYVKQLGNDLICRIEQERNKISATFERAQSDALRQLQHDFMLNIEEVRAAAQHSDLARSLETRLLAEHTRWNAELRSVTDTVQAALTQIAGLQDGLARLSSITESARTEAATEQQAAGEHVRLEISRLAEEMHRETRALLEHVRPALEQQMLIFTQAQEAERNSVMQMSEREAAAREAVGADLVATEHRLVTAEGRIGQAERKLVSVCDGLRSQEMRLSVVLEQARKRLADMNAGQLSALAQEDAHKLDAIYLTFEDQFRGTREDIKERLRVYLPSLKERGIGTAEMPILDVGCGRGEWLELLREETLQARGVDSNRAMLARCVERRLHTTESDAVDYLRGLDSESLGGVTGFHIIEHLPFQRLLDLLDETVRVLKTGGVAIFETPNPANVLVGAERFYFDPTHRNPLPIPLMRFLAEERGLCRVEVLELHAWPEAYRLQEDHSTIAERFNQLFYGPQDYAIIGWKV